MNDTAEPKTVPTERVVWTGSQADLITERQMNEELIAALRRVLPMAVGYVAAHPTTINRSLVQLATRTLNKAQKHLAESL